MNQRQAMVTGASEGIGRALARRLAKEGFAIHAVARNEARLKELMAELPGENSYQVADLSTPEGVSAVAATFAERRFHLLVNNAGAGLFGRFAEQEIDQVLKMMHLNMTSMVTLAHAFLRQAQAGDALMNLSSGLAFMPLPTSGVYSATKSFVNSFSEFLWFEQKERGVYVMGLCPGMTETSFFAKAGAGHQKLPKAMLQNPDDVAEEAVAALKERKNPTVICGKLHRLMMLTTRLRSRKALVEQMGNMAAQW